MEGYFNFVSLEKKLRYTLGKAERLKSRKTIEQLFKEGKSFSIYPFRVLFLFNQPSSDNSHLSKHHAPLQAGFTVSSRHFKKAVDRNRIKRLMKESYRLQKNNLEQVTVLNNNSLAVFFIYIGKEIAAYELVYEKMNLVVQRLINITGGKR